MSLRRGREAKSVVIVLGIATALDIVNDVGGTALNTEENK